MDLRRQIPRSGSCVVSALSVLSTEYSEQWGAVLVLVPDVYVDLYEDNLIVVLQAIVVIRPQESNT